MRMVISNHIRNTEIAMEEDDDQRSYAAQRIKSTKSGGVGRRGHTLRLQEPCIGVKLPVVPLTFATAVANRIDVFLRYVYEFGPASS